MRAVSMQAVSFANSLPKPTAGADGLFTGVVESRYDPKEYNQVDQFGQLYSLDQLSREDLMQLACYGIDAMERMDVLIDKQLQLADSWRKDMQLPVESVD
jgi:hypothetical protein